MVEDKVEDEDITSNVSHALVFPLALIEARNI